MTENIYNCPYHTKEIEISEVDMLDANMRINPYPYYNWLQHDESRRIYKLPQEESFYLVHQFEDVKAVLSNNKDFINHILPTKKSLFFALMDGEEHLRIRTLVAKLLSINNESFPINDINKNIKTLTQELIQNKEVELFKEWAIPIPLASICILLGLNNDKKTISDLHEKAVLVNRSLFALGATGPRRKSTPNLSEKLAITWELIKNYKKIRAISKIVGKDGMKEIKEMFVPQKTKIDVPRPNFNELPNAIAPLLEIMLMFASSLKNNSSERVAINMLNEAISKNELTKAEAIMVCTFVVFAGYEPTSSILSNCFAHLAQNKKTYNSLKENPESIEIFIEEALRIYTPVGRFIRRAAKEVLIGNQVIPKDAIVIVLLGGANTDPKKYDVPFSLNYERENAKTHLSFGKGIHYCLGAPLARYQVKRALEELIKNTKSINIKDSSSLEVITDRDNGILRYKKLYAKID